MASPIAPTISATGISAPSYADVLDYLKTAYRSIYGADTYLENDSQDGQFLGVLALAISDSNAAIIGSYLSYSPATGQGAGLSSTVKINGMRRAVSSHSQADLTLIGQAGTTISQGIVEDQAGNKWALPDQVVIPPSGEVIVTATCKSEGSITAKPGQISKIATVIRGWQSVTNAASASPGAPVETDAKLRMRQKISVALPSRTVLEGTAGAVASVFGVTRYRPYENDDDLPDAHGIPGHKIAIVVEGGDVTDIANAIASHKGPGGGTHGDVAITVADVYGMPITIRFFRPVRHRITASISLRPLPGFAAPIGDSIRQAVSDYVNQVEIGGGVSGVVEWADAITAANTVPNNETFKITGLVLSGESGPGSPDVPLAFNEAADCIPDDVTLVVN